MDLNFTVRIGDLSDGTDPELVRSEIEVVLRNFITAELQLDTATVVVDQAAEQWIAVTGNPVEGFSFYGPWSEGNDAADSVDADLTPDWWVAKLRPQAELADPNADG